MKKTALRFLVIIGLLIFVIGGSVLFYKISTRETINNDTDEEPIQEQPYSSPENNDEDNEAGALAEPAKPIQPDEDGLLGIRLSDPIDTVFEKLGRPKAERLEAGMRVLRYDGISITIDNDKVCRVLLYGEGMKTPRGLALFDDEYPGWKRLRELYGERSYSTSIDGSEGHGFVDLHYDLGDWEFVARTIEEGDITSVWVTRKYPNAPRIAIEDEIFGFKLGDSKEKVISCLGNPSRMGRDQDREILYYEGKRIELIDDIIVKVFVNGAGLQTPRGLFIGLDTIQDIANLYGSEDRLGGASGIPGGYRDWHFEEDGWEFVIRDSARDWVVRAFWLEKM